MSGLKKKLHLNAVASRAEMTVSSVSQQEVILLTCVIVPGSRLEEAGTGRGEIGVIR